MKVLKMKNSFIFDKPCIGTGDGFSVKKYSARDHQFCQFWRSQVPGLQHISGNTYREGLNKVSTCQARRHHLHGYYEGQIFFSGILIMHCKTFNE